MVRSCLVAPETGRKRHLSRKQKGETGRGLVRNRTRVEPSLLVFVRLRLHRPNPHETTSAPTSTRDGPHVGTHICARPLRIHYSEFLERSQLRPTNSSFFQFTARNSDFQFKKQFRILFSKKQFRLNSSFAGKELATRKNNA